MLDNITISETEPIYVLYIFFYLFLFQTSTTQPIVRTSQVSLSSNPDADFRYSMIYTQIGVYKGRIFAIKKIRKKSIEITREMKKELKIVIELINPPICLLHLFLLKYFNGNLVMAVTNSIYLL